MSDQETLELIAKLTANMNAIALVVGEMLATEAKGTSNPSAHVRQIEKKAKEFLAQNPFGPDPNAKQMLAWAQQRAELIVLHALDRLAKG